MQEKALLKVQATSPVRLEYMAVRLQRLCRFTLHVLWDGLGFAGRFVRVGACDVLFEAC